MTTFSVQSSEFETLGLQKAFPELDSILVRVLFSVFCFILGFIAPNLAKRARLSVGHMHDEFGFREAEGFLQLETNFRVGNKIKTEV